MHLRSQRKPNAREENADFSSVFCSEDYAPVLSVNGFVMSKHTSILNGVMINWNEESCDKRISKGEF